VKNGRGKVLAVNLADLGIGAVVGAIIAGAAALALDQRRRNWEKKNRFQDDKRRTYRAYLLICDLVVIDLELVTGLLPMQERLAEGDANSPNVAIQASRLERLERNQATRRELMGDALSELRLLASPSTRRPGYIMAETLEKMHRALEEYFAGRLSDARWEKELVALKLEYYRAREEFRDHARRDIGINV
jgi:hypothetical protein